MATTTLDLIANSSILELRSCVMETKLSPSSTKTYTKVLSEEEELAAVKKLVVDAKAERSAWLAFMTEYSLKYPLCNQAVDYLIQHSGIEAVCTLLVSLFSRYGYTVEQGTQICELARKHKNEQIARLLNSVCNSGHIYYGELASQLVNLDLHSTDENPTCYAETYKKGIEKYQRAHELTKFKEIKKDSIT